VGTGVGSGAPPPYTPPPGPPAVPWTPAPAAPIWTAAPPAPHTAPHRAPKTGRVPRAALACLVLGAVLVAGGAAGHLAGGDASSAGSGAAATAQAFQDTRVLWHSLPVDTLFPRTLTARGAGPGGADRTWIRVGAAPDSGCTGAFDPALAEALAPAGCLRLLRATYTDATSTDVTTVGILITRSTPAAQAAFARTFAARGTAARSGAVPRPVAFPGTAAAGFGRAERASWTVRVETGLPVVLYAVSGFADGRTVPTPQPAAAAVRKGATSVPAQSGLGYEARGLAAAVGDRLAATVRTARSGGGR